MYKVSVYSGIVMGCVFMAVGLGLVVYRYHEGLGSSAVMFGAIVAFYGAFRMLRGYAGYRDLKRRQANETTNSRLPKL